MAIVDYTFKLDQEIEKKHDSFYFDKELCDHKNGGLMWEIKELTHAIKRAGFTVYKRDTGEDNVKQGQKITHPAFPCSISIERRILLAKGNLIVLQWDFEETGASKARWPTFESSGMYFSRHTLQSDELDCKAQHSCAIPTDENPFWKQINDITTQGRKSKSDLLEVMRFLANHHPHTLIGETRGQK